MSPEEQSELLETLATDPAGLPMNSLANEEELPEIQAVLLELATLRQQEQRAAEPSIFEEPHLEDTAERVGESGGSVAGSYRSSAFYQTTSSRVRMRMRVGTNRPPPVDELEDGKEDEDLERRFNKSREAYHEYLDMESRTVILDKGFEHTQLNHGLISYMVREHGWTGFCAHHDEDSNWELLREFYANLNPLTETTWVRGRTIQIDATSLNRFLGTREQTGILTYELLTRHIVTRKEQETMRKIAWAMCGRSPKYLVGYNFSDTQVRVELKPALDFYFSKIKPITHTHRVSGISLYGLSEILLGKAINIGEIICKTMKTKRTVLSHPNLVRRLCENAGVDLSEFSADAIPIGGPIPLIVWDQPEFRYELGHPSMEPQPAQQPQPEGEQSRAPPPGPIKSKKPAPRGRGRKKQRLSRGEERTINQGEVPEPTEVRTETRNELVPGATIHTEGHQVTDIQQTLMTMQRATESHIDRLNEARIRERALELEHKREEAERQAKREDKREKRRMEWEKEQQRENREFQMKMQASLTDFMGSLVRQIPQLIQSVIPSTSRDPQNAPSQPSASTDPQPSESDRAPPPPPAPES